MTLPLTPVTAGSLTLASPPAGGAYSFADFVIDGVSGVSVATPLRAGLGGYSDTDFGAVLQSVLTALKSSAGNAVGTVIVQGSHANSTVAALPPVTSGTTADTRLLRIMGVGAATVTLSTGGPRFLDFDKVADHDWFGNLEITDLVIDCNNVGGQHHVVLGTYVGGTQVTRVNLDRIAIRRVKTVNVPEDGATVSPNHRPNIFLSPAHSALNEATQTTVTNIVVEDCDLNGGSGGVAIGGSNTASGGDTNIWVDNIVVERVRHTCGVVPTASHSSSNFIIGNNGRGGSVVIRDCYGQYSGDVGVEIDAMASALVENVTIEDAYNIAFYRTNYSAVKTKAGTANVAQVVEFRNCHAKKYQLTATGNGWRWTGTNSNELGTERLTGCSFLYTGNPISAAWSALLLDSAAGVPAIRRLVVDGFVADYANLSQTSGTGFTPIVVNLITLNDIKSTIDLRRIAIRLNGTAAGATISNFTGISLGGVCTFRIDGYDFEESVTSMGNGVTRVLNIGGVTSTMRGTVRGMKIRSISSDTSPLLVRIGGTGTLTVAPNFIDIYENDWSAAPTGATEISYVATSNAGNVRVFRNIWKNGNVRPAPSSLTGLVTDTGKTLATGYDCIATFTQGSGAAITAIDYSTNGGTTYTNYLTQSSGALPAGFDQTLGPLPTDALIKVTFATTQPTITLVPVNP